MPRIALSVLVLLLVAPGCQSLRSSMPRWTFQRPPQPPRSLTETPTLAQVIEVVNANTGRVRTLSTSTARITSPGTPALRANIVMEPPRRLRLRADTVITGPEVDLGSNDELFWFWVKRSQPPALYYCRHEEFAASGARAYLPIDAQWLGEAIGLPRLDPAGKHVGPTLVRGNRLEIRTRLSTPEGEQTRVTLVDRYFGYAVEQHVYGASGQRIASAIAAGHRFDPTTGVTLPQTVEIQAPAVQLQLKIDLGDVAINRGAGDGSQVWNLPTYEGAQSIDVGRLLPAGTTAPAAAPHSPAAAPVESNLAPPGGAGQGTNSAQAPSPTRTFAGVPYPSVGQTVPVETRRGVLAQRLAQHDADFARYGRANAPPPLSRPPTVRLPTWLPPQ